MSFAESILPEFDHEMANTRRALERVPEDKLDWRPHVKSNTLGWVASHLAEIPGLTENVLTEPSFDVRPTGGKDVRTLVLKTHREILDTFDRNVAAARQVIAAFPDARMAEPWSLLEGGTPIITLPRGVVLRQFVLSHIIHHRAALCVYLRLNDVPVPGMFGPSGDE
jgi:uncharacterized damage-inducible protein DinB